MFNILSPQWLHNHISQREKKTNGNKLKIYWEHIRIKFIAISLPQAIIKTNSCLYLWEAIECMLLSLKYGEEEKLGEKNINQERLEDILMS